MPFLKASRPLHRSCLFVPSQRCRRREGASERLKRGGEGIVYGVGCSGGAGAPHTEGVSGVACRRWRHQPGDRRER